MLKISFKAQLMIAAIIVIGGFVFSLYFENDIFYNFTWAFVGVLFFINPVYPESKVHLEEVKAQKAMRIAAVVVFFAGITNGFGVQLPVTKLIILQEREE